ncbi:hypothetical protein Q1695_008109 [Nippostrongylus brasiliensis]|nr:hypothetical protein Q1695_008109 [Nippostrongylus brasiliensis]
MCRLGADKNNAASLAVVPWFSSSSSVQNPLRLSSFAIADVVRSESTYDAVAPPRSTILSGCGDDSELREPLRTIKIASGKCESLADSLKIAHCPPPPAEPHTNNDVFIFSSQVVVVEDCVILSGQAQPNTIPSTTTTIVFLLLPDS